MRIWPRSATCRCGHALAAHEHYRPGRDCGICGVEVCPRFRGEPARWGRLLRREQPAERGRAHRPAPRPHEDGGHRSDGPEAA